MIFSKVRFLFRRDSLRGTLFTPACHLRAWVPSVRLSWRHLRSALAGVGTGGRSLRLHGQLGIQLPCWHLPWRSPRSRKETLARVGPSGAEGGRGGPRGPEGGRGGPRGPEWARVGPSGAEWGRVGPSGAEWGRGAGIGSPSRNALRRRQGGGVRQSGDPVML